MTGKTPASFAVMDLEGLMSKMIRFHNFGSKDVLKAEDVEISQPDASEVLVSVHAASINPVDFKIRSGK
jgi:NADPH:quinone reductase-like Zn-dependent oxidoreductase